MMTSSPTMPAAALISVLLLIASQDQPGARGDMTLREKASSLRLNPFVPLSHCMTMGEEGDFKLE